MLHTLRKNPDLVCGWRDIAPLLSFGRFGGPGTSGHSISSKLSDGTHALGEREVPCKKHSEYLPYCIFSDSGTLELGMAGRAGSVSM